MDNVELEFTPDALSALASKSLERKIGARGLNNLIENMMNNLMFEIPSNKTIKKVIIDKEVVDGLKDPIIIKKPKKTKAVVSKSKADKVSKNVKSAG
jgi:ATP-dependent Clp protease ATP-binding subunit ClpX